MIGIDPKVDFACKLVLGSPDHPAITLHFLNAVLKGDPLITEVSILNPIKDRDFENDKLSILDVLACDAVGRRFDIEIQRTIPAGLPERLTYYTATQLVEQLREGDDYFELHPSIGICILDAIMFRDIQAFHLDFRLVNPTFSLTLTDCLQIHLLELPKYQVPADNEPVTDPIQQWAYFFSRAQDSTPEELIQKLPDPVFHEATGILEMISRDPDQRILYHFRRKAELDAKARLLYALNEGIQQGRDQGRAEGREEGREEGRAEGREEGREEGMARGKIEGEARGQVIGRIQLLQQMLGHTVDETSTLRTQSLDELTALAADLQQQLSDRK